MSQSLIQGDNYSIQCLVSHPRLENSAGVFGKWMGSPAVVQLVGVGVGGGSS